MELDTATLELCTRSCAALSTRRASRAVTRAYGDLFATLGLESTQYSLLVAGAVADGVTVSRLATFLSIDRSALARNLSLLEERGLVSITPGRDRRARHVSLTVAGRALLAEALPIWRRAQDRVEQAFGADRLRHLVGELRALTDLMSTT